MASEIIFPIFFRLNVVVFYRNYVILPHFLPLHMYQTISGKTKWKKALPLVWITFPFSKGELERRFFHSVYLLYYVNRDSFLHNPYFYWFSFFPIWSSVRFGRDFLPDDITVSRRALLTSAETFLPPITQIAQSFNSFPSVIRGRLTSHILFDTETKRLKQNVKRNKKRFRTILKSMYSINPYSEKTGGNKWFHFRIPCNPFNLYLWLSTKRILWLLNSSPAPCMAWKRLRLQRKSMYSTD